MLQGPPPMEHDDMLAHGEVHDNDLPMITGVLDVKTDEPVLLLC